MKKRKSPTKKRIAELAKKYREGQATDEEIRELFTALGESEPEINLRIAIERDMLEPGTIP